MTSTTARLSLFALGLVALTACGGPVTEEDYAASYARTYCKTTQTCARGFFENEWKDMADCEDEVNEDIEDLMDFADDIDCEFRDDKAGECIDDLRTMSCEDFYENKWVDDCLETWDDCGGDLNF